MPQQAAKPIIVTQRRLRMAALGSNADRPLLASEKR